MKTAIVTGASKGVGLATVKLLSENGYRVIAVSRNLSEVFRLQSKNIEPYIMDITQPKEIELFFELIKNIKNLSLIIDEFHLFSSKYAKLPTTASTSLSAFASKLFFTSFSLG
jgi:nucleoside-diphosphate-sugar epimerase